MLHERGSRQSQDHGSVNALCPLTFWTMRLQMSELEFAAERFRMTDPDTDKADYESMWVRLVSMIVIAVLLSFAYSLLGILTVIQFIIMVFNKRQPNEQLAEFGTTMGVWMAKAIRYQTGASEVKPWPWTELD